MSPCDYRKYPPDWIARRRRILDRSGNRCECCGVENHAVGVRDKVGRWHSTDDLAGGSLYGDDTEYRLIRIVLTIAHLDHDEDNWSVADDRLQALCQRCHLALDLSRHMNKAALTRDRNRGQLRFELETRR